MITLDRAIEGINEMLAELRDTKFTITLSSLTSERPVLTGSFADVFADDGVNGVIDLLREHMNADDLKEVERYMRLKLAA